MLPGGCRVVKGGRYRFMMCRGADRYGEVTQVLAAAYVVVLLKPFNAGLVVLPRGAECLIERGQVKRVAEVL